MSKQTLVRRYLAAMAVGDLPEVLSCFDVGANVVSPVYGEVAVEPFYRQLFTDTLRTSIAIHGIYQDTTDERRMIAHFFYQWERRTGPRVETDLIDLFTLDTPCERIMRLRIVPVGPIMC